MNRAGRLVGLIHGHNSPETTLVADQVWRRPADGDLKEDDLLKLPQSPQLGSSSQPPAMDRAESMNRQLSAYDPNPSGETAQLHRGLLIRR